MFVFCKFKYQWDEHAKTISAVEVHNLLPFVETVVPSYDFVDFAGTDPCSQAVSSVGGCIGKGRATKEAVLTLDKGVGHPVVGVFD